MRNWWILANPIAKVAMISLVIGTVAGVVAGMWI